MTSGREVKERRGTVRQKSEGLEGNWQAVRE